MMFLLGTCCRRYSLLFRFTNGILDVVGDVNVDYADGLDYVDYDDDNDDDDDDDDDDDADDDDDDDDEDDDDDDDDDDDVVLVGGLFLVFC